MTLTCPICSSSSLSELRSHVSDYQARAYHLYECASCGVQHWRPLLHPERTYYEDEAMDMYAGMHDGRQSVSDPRFTKFLAEFEHVAPRRVLDVGCSDGVFLDRMKGSGHDVWGLDIDRKGLDAARRRGLQNLHCLRVDEFVEHARTNGLAFAMITVFDVLEHLVDPVATLRGLQSILEPEGYLVGTVPNRKRLLADYVRSDFPPHHFFRFDAPSLATCVTSSGLIVDRVDIFQYGYTANTALDAMLRKRKLKHRGTREDVVGPKAPIGQPRNSRLRRALGRTIAAAMAIPSYAVERPGQHGFKLYFVSRRPTTGTS